jgi:hypothetical protein
MKSTKARESRDLSHQWSLSWVSTGAAAFGTPMVGEFKDGRGTFYDMETVGGRQILVRNVWSEIMPTSSKFEQAFSTDGGTTWEMNWVATNHGETRQKS